MSERPWYRRFPSDFISGTLGMTLEEKGAYGIVLDLIYDRGGPIPDDSRFIAGACNCSVRKWNAIRDRLLIMGKLVMVEGDSLSNRRAEKELEIVETEARKAAENGRKGGEKSAETRAAAKENNDLGQAGLKHHARVSTPDTSKEKGEKGTDPTARLEFHRDDAIFREIVRQRGGKEPPVGNSGYWAFERAEVEAAKAALKPKAAVH